MINRRKEIFRKLKFDKTPIKSQNVKPYLNKILDHRIFKNKRTNKRGKRKSAQKVMRSIILTGFNPNGFKSKLTTIKKLIRDTCSAVITMQETKCNQAGHIKLDGYFTYELTRSNKDGGGVAISALKNLQPAFVSDGGDNAEAVTIDIHVRNMTISITSAYGPQESAEMDKKYKF